MTTIEDAITTYYQKKATYEKDYERKKEIIRKNKELSVIEKREKINNIVRKCIVCESPEGTLFSQTGRVLSAICGNRASPCSLNINITRPTVIKYDTVEEKLDNQINKLKDDIIKSKYNILFNFSQFDTAFVDKSDQIREKIKDYDDMKKRYSEIYDKNTQLLKRIEKVSDEEYNFLVKVEELKKILKEKDYPGANEHYINIMLPIINKIRENKYEMIDIVRETRDGNVLINEDKSDKGEIMRLIREPVSLNNELIIISNGSVNSNEYKKERPDKKEKKPKLVISEEISL